MEGGLKVLILGGTGFIGRHLVNLLVQKGVCSLIRVADKNLPAMAWFTPQDDQLFKTEPVQFKMANLINEASVAKAFEIEEGVQFDMVIDLASTMEYGKEKELYEHNVVGVAKVCGAEAKKRNIPKWIEVSTAQVYKPDKKESTEKDKPEPWTNLAHAKLKCEEILREIGLPLIIVRPAIVYGPGDVLGIMPRLVCGAVYRELKEEMKFLWSADLQLNTIHVDDVSEAIWFLANGGSIGEIYNIVDNGHTDQGRVNKAISEIFKIKTGFLGWMLSKTAQINFKATVEHINEKHIQPWGELAEREGITRTPLTPYLDQELLLNNDTCIDGSKLAKMGFKLQHPELTTELLLESLQYWVSIKAFPPLP